AAEGAVTDALEPAGDTCLVFLAKAREFRRHLQDAVVPLFNGDAADALALELRARARGENPVTDVVVDIGPGRLAPDGRALVALVRLGLGAQDPVGSAL